MARRRTSGKPCLFCGQTGSLSREHVIPKWARKALGAHGVIEERSGVTRRMDALAVILPQVCTGCNTGWMNALEQRVRPFLAPMFLGSASALPVVLDPAQQATLATWAVKTSLLLTIRKFGKGPGGWTPADNLEWLYRHRKSDMSPPGARVWLAGLRPHDGSASRKLSASAQAWCKLDAAGEPVAHMGTFTVGYVLLQVFCREQRNSAPSPEIDAWLEPRGPYRSSLLQIAPSSRSIRWPPDAVFAVDALAIVGGRFEHDGGIVR